MAGRTGKTVVFKASKVLYDGLSKTAKRVAASSPEQSVSNGSSKRHTILVADDFDDTRAVIRKTLEMRGYDVVEARDGKEALELVQWQCPDLILMDLSMPQVDGLEATEQIRECKNHCENVTILAITAFDTYGMKEAAFEAGCDGYLKKPIDFQHLESLIAFTLESE